MAGQPEARHQLSDQTGAPDGAHAAHPIGPGPRRSFPTPPMYGSRAVDTPLVDLAFLGRVSDEDLQDPTLSIPR